MQMEPYCRPDNHNADDLPHYVVTNYSSLHFVEQVLL
jgi:hypothetical protein